jgi:hypothetical protein
LNRFSYVDNNPLKYVDPTGHFSWDQIAEFLAWGGKYEYPGDKYYPEYGNGTDGVRLTPGAYLQAMYENGDLNDSTTAAVGMLLEAEFGDVLLTGEGTDPSIGYAGDRLLFVADKYDYDNAGIMLWSDSKGGFVNRNEIMKASKWQLYRAGRGASNPVVRPYSPTSISYSEGSTGQCNYNVKNMRSVFEFTNLRPDQGLWVDYGLWISASESNLNTLASGAATDAVKGGEPSKTAGAAVRFLFTYPVARSWYEVSARRFVPGWQIATAAIDAGKWLVP